MVSDTVEDDEMMEAAVEPLLDLMKIGGGLNDRMSEVRSLSVIPLSVILLRACSVGTGNGLSITGRSFTVFAMGSGGSVTRDI